ncbi:MAG: DUF4845 domain-containing protein [Candidatus Dadabacteria bacterium]|nr:MAG: DUF4845 domain-containing protein [Candidatus Dadabacteria bacterium]
MKSIEVIKREINGMGAGGYKDQGASKLTVLVFAAIFGVAFYCAYHIIPFYYYFYELQNQFESAVKVASTYTDKEIRRKLMYHIKKMQLPVEPDDLEIIRQDGKIKISLEYEEVFYITFRGKDYDIWTFPFHAYAEGNVN